MARAKTPAAPVLASVRPLDLSLHEIAVRLTLPAEALAEGAILALPAWTPGSYLVRDYSRFLDRLKVVDARGRAWPVTKLDKQRWRLAPATGPLTVSYRLFANELTVRTNHVDGHHAHLVGAATFLYLEGQGQRPLEVRFEGWPETWKVASALPVRAGAYLAADHDTLVDSPFELGTFRLHSFRSGGCAFQVAVTGAHVGDEARVIAATQAVVAACAGIFGGFPFKRYLFLLTFSPKLRGGLEHRDCTSLLADPFQLERPEGYWDLFTLIAHEFFHVWNVKRMHDPILGPFDYRGENPTRLLWFHEGFTSFMQYAIVLQAGVVPWSWVARKLAGSWADNLQRPGRLEQSLEEASFDAWIRHYKPTEFATNSTVSYYDKGAMVGWMMDAELRLASRGERGLADLFRHLWDQVGDGPVTDAEVRGAYRALTGKDPARFWAAYIQGRASLDPDPIERAYGLTLTLKAPWETLAEGEAQDPEALARARAHAGLTLAGDGPVIQNVLPGGPAARAGLAYGMEILAVGGFRTAGSQEAQRRLGDGGPGAELEVLATHLGRVASYRLRLGENPGRTVQLGWLPRPSPAQSAARAAWLGPAAPVRRTGVRK
jgi:predicted metalloprotease with PDZ domain